MLKRYDSDGTLNKNGEWIKTLDYLEEKRSSSWFVDDGFCKECGYKVIITQSIKADYFWYCSNKYCKNHEGEELGDQEECSWST